MLLSPDGPRLAPGLRWEHETPPLRALEYEFAVRATDGALGRHLERVFRPLAGGGGGAHPGRVYSVVSAPGAAIDLWLDDGLVFRSSHPRAVLAHLLWHVNRQVIAASSARYLLVHAAAAEYRGTGVLLPAGMGAGKTTLVAGLVQAGLGYLTDEAAAVDMGSLRLHPFPRALSLDSGSWPVLPELRPPVEAGAAPWVGGQWQVDPESIRPGSVARPCPPHLVVFPQYQPGGPSELVPVRRSDSVVLLADQCFNFHQHGRQALVALAGVVRQSECYRLRVGDLREACTLLVDHLAGSDRHARLHGDGSN